MVSFTIYGIAPYEGSMKYRVLLTIGLLFSVGCGASFGQLQARAALDFDCPSGEISAKAVDGQTRLVSGCGKRAIYVATCTDRYEMNCTWMLNSEIRPVMTAAK
jgi:hypothetical protein